MSVEEENQSRLSLWSKRKLAVAKEAEVDEARALLEAPEPDSEAEAALAAEHEANRLAAEAIDLEAIDEDTDFSVFMKDGVPKLLKKSAMAILWRTNPIFANVDGLVDYDDDFGSPDLIMKTFKSAYQIGKGYLDKVEEEESENSDELADDEAAEPVDEIAEGEELAEETVAENDEETEMEPVELSQADAPDEFAEPDVIEPTEEVEIRPKISLRHRLMLDS